MDSIQDLQFLFFFDSVSNIPVLFLICCFCMLNYEKEIYFTKSTPINSVTVRRHISSLCFFICVEFLVAETYSSPFIDSKHSAKVQLLAFSGYLAIGPKQPTTY